MKTGKTYDQHYMANIQVVLQQKKLWKQAQFDHLMSLSSWTDSQQYLKNHGYTLTGTPVLVADIDALYRQGLEDLERIITELALPTSLFDVLFVQEDLVQGAYKIGTADEEILKKYLAFIEEARYPLMVEYAKMSLDCYFLTQAFRHKKQPVKYLDYAKGYLSGETIKKVKELDNSAACKLLKKGHYYQLFDQQVESSQLLQLFDQAIIAKLRPYHHQVIGIEGIFAYIVEKQMELFNLRLILKGKLYHLPLNDIEERMRLTYV